MEKTELQKLCEKLGYEKALNDILKGMWEQVEDGQIISQDVMLEIINNLTYNEE